MSMDSEVLTAQELELMAIVPLDGATRGNGWMMNQLKWEPPKYWEVRNGLLDKGLIVTGTGRGGSIRRVIETTDPNVKASSLEVKATSGEYSEESLYAPILNVLRDQWTKEQRLEDFVVEITAKQGRRETGGTWSRPDIVVISISLLKFIPGKFLDIHTFEIKPYTSIDVTAVYEALAHLRSSTKASVIFHVPAEIRKEEWFHKRLTDIKEEANRHGIGLILAENVTDYNTWEVVLETVRRDTDPMRLNEFISTQITADAKHQLEKWIR